MTRGSKTPFLLALLTVGAIVVLLRSVAPEGEPRSTEGRRQAEASGQATTARPGQAAAQAVADETGKPGTGGDSLPREVVRRGRPELRALLQRDCRAKSEPCACRAARVRSSLDLGRADWASRFLERPEDCPPEADIGFRAELATALGKLDAAAGFARIAIAAARAGGPFATEQAGFAHVALARVERSRHRFDQAIEHAQAAVDAGRGQPAMVLLVELLVQAGDRKEARAALQMMKNNPGHPDTLYAEALLHQLVDEYGAARRAHLQALKSDPDYASARFQLGLLTHSVGALAEARHNLSRLETLVGFDDPRVKHLRSVIAGPPAPAGRQFVFSPAEPHRQSQ